MNEHTSTTTRLDQMVGSERASIDAHCNKVKNKNETGAEGQECASSANVSDS